MCVIDTIYWNQPESIQRLVADLSQEKVALTSTDTVLGLLGMVSKEVVLKINQIKGRDEKKPNIILVGSAQKAAHFIKISAGSVAERLSQYWPAPLTIIGDAQDWVPEYACSVDKKVAVRVPDHKGLLQLLAHFDGLFSTSANMHGAPVPTSVSEIEESVLKKVSCLVLDPTKQEYPICPSTIVDCSGDQVKIIRQGACILDDL